MERKLQQPQSFIALESLGGLLIIAASLVALTLANTGLQQGYFELLETPLYFGIHHWHLKKTLLLWINDGLMALFFLLIGLELKREVLEGQLSQISQIILPGVAALGGIILPALIYAYFNQNNPMHLKGWSIPTATDIAFALSMLTLFGSRVPAGLKIFLMTVAVFDDISGIMIIAVFYTQDLSWSALGLALIGGIVLWGLNKRNVTRIGIYLLVGCYLWICVLKSGVHATLSGFLLAMAIPNCAEGSGSTPLRRLETGLHGWVTYCILPLFALANAGISFKGITGSDLLNPLTLGIAVGLFVGKQVGIFSFTWLLIKCRLAKLPPQVSWGHIYGAALLCGIGFTMSLFMSTLAFEHYPETIILSRLGIFCGTLVSALVGLCVLRWVLR